MRKRSSIAAGLGAALAIAGSSLVALPAAAVPTCTSGQSPKVPGGSSSLAIGCVVDVSATPSANATALEIHDGLNGQWHRGSARSVAVGVTLNTKTITYAAGVITAADLRRPISGPGIAGGAFIVTAGATSGTVSRASSATSAATAPKLVEHTNARVLDDAKYPIGAATSVLTSLSGAFAATDVNKAVSGGGFPVGARISAVTNATTAVVTPGANARGGQVLTGNGTRTTGTKNITAWTGTALVTASDVGATVAGAGIPVGTKIATVTSGTTFTLSANATASGATALTITEPLDQIQVGGNQYSAASPSLAQTYPDTQTRNMVKTTGVACAAGVLTSTTAGGGFKAADVGLPVVFANAGVAVVGSWKVAATPVPTATQVRLTPLTCPAVWTSLAIGKVSASAPIDNSPIAKLGATLNVDPAISGTVDNCNKNTYEAFSFAGRWRNPGSYETSALGGAPANSLAQIVFDTGSIGFAGYLVPVATDAQQAGVHTDVVFPFLPTGLAGVICAPVAGVVTTASAGVSVSINGSASIPVTNAPASDAGNPSSFSVRGLGPQTGTFGPKILVKNGATTLATLAPTPCVFAASTVAPTFACGLG